MSVVNLVFGRIVDTVLLPFRSLSPWFGLAVVSLLTALLMLEVYKLTSNQSAIRRAKDRIKAHLLEMRLYKDSLRVTLRAQAGILKANLAYMGANLKPLLVMIVPLVLILARLSVWYDRAPRPIPSRSVSGSKRRRPSRSRPRPSASPTSTRSSGGSGPSPRAGAAS